jgi:hypothetical protein
MLATCVVDPHMISVLLHIAYTVFVTREVFTCESNINLN